MNESTVRRNIIWSSASATDVGCIRKVNEDAILARSDLGVWGVADGMGGHEVGDLASSLITQKLDAISLQANLNQLVNTVDEGLRTVNDEIVLYSENVLDHKTIGSTVVTLLIKGNRGACLWAGDSRLYRIRNGQLEQISRDHSRVEELIQLGLIDREQAKNHAESNIITRAIGVDREVEIESRLFDVQVRDMFLLCSDGLYNVVSEASLLAHTNEKDLETSVVDLINLALQNGAPDNVSVVLVKGEFERSLGQQIGIQ